MRERRLKYLRHNVVMNRRTAALAVVLLVALGLTALGLAALQRAKPSALARLPALTSMPAACAFAAESDAAESIAVGRNVSFRAGDATPWTGQPLRLADWAASRQSLLILTAGKDPASEALSLYDPRTGASEPAGQRPASTLLPHWADGSGRVTMQQDLETGAQLLNQPRVAGVPTASLVTTAVRVIQRPDSSQSLVFGALRAVLMDSAGGGCTLTINWDGDVDLPLIDAAWSGDGRFLAVLMMSDPGRLGTTALRVLDMSLGQWRTVQAQDGAISAMRWRPAGHELYFAVTHLDKPERLDTLAAIDAGTAAPIDIAGAPELFAPAYWGFVFSGDGRVLYAACGAPDADGVLRTNAICHWMVSP